MVITEKLRSDLRKVTPQSPWPICVIKGKIARFEALAAALSYRQTDSGISKNSIDFSVYCLVSLPLQEE
jgi:hypothetical protein